MKIKDIMSKDLQIVTPATSLVEVAKKMQKSDCGSILVVTEGQLVGVITDRDLALRCIAEAHHPAETTAEQVMTKQILYCRDNDDTESVVLNMTANKVRRLPVLDKDKRLVGIISLGDLASHSSDRHYLICGKALGLICSAPANISSADGHGFIMLK